MSLQYQIAIPRVFALA